MHLDWSIAGYCSAVVGIVVGGLALLKAIAVVLSAEASRAAGAAWRDAAEGFQTDIESLRNALAAANSREKELVAKVKMLDLNVAELRRREHQLHVELDRLRTENRDLRAENQQLRTESQQQRDDISAMRAHLARLDPGGELP
jgi:septal ring factor EnvC (AmiA/AmiB activator)